MIDTNVLISYFWKESIARKILISQDIKLFSPEFALEEINQHKKEIIKKTKITQKEFDTSKTDLAISVYFFPLEQYSNFLIKAIKFSPDPDDIDFFALCLKLNLPLWSNDNRLKKQNNVPVFSTTDLFDKFKDIIFPDGVE